jgi:hypothetical protein
MIWEAPKLSSKQNLYPRKEAGVGLRGLGRIRMLVMVTKESLERAVQTMWIIRNGSLAKNARNGGVFHLMSPPIVCRTSGTVR